MTETKHIIQLSDYCHNLADLLDAETRLINKRQITDIQIFVSKKSEMATKMAQIGDNFKKIPDYEKYPELKGARIRLAKSVKRNHFILAKSKNLLEALMRNIAKKATQQKYNKNIYNQNNDIDKQNATPIACNKIS